MKSAVSFPCKFPSLAINVMVSVPVNSKGGTNNAMLVFSFIVRLIELFPDAVNVKLSLSGSEK